MKLWASSGDSGYFRSCIQLQLPKLQSLLRVGKEHVLPRYNTIEITHFKWNSITWTLSYSKILLCYLGLMDITILLPFPQTNPWWLPSKYHALCCIFTTKHYSVFSYRIPHKTETQMFLEDKNWPSRNADGQQVIWEDRYSTSLIIREMQIKNHNVIHTCQNDHHQKEHK